MNTKFKILLVRWAFDDLGVSQEIDRLDRIFTNFYHYEVSKYCIPDFQASSALNKRILQFIGDGVPDTLLIFYNGGHGQRDLIWNETYWGAQVSYYQALRNTPINA
jgi:hypothetical protein